jgi:hypothetical protein
MSAKYWQASALRGLHSGAMMTSVWAKSSGSVFELRAVSGAAGLHQLSRMLISFRECYRSASVPAFFSR